MTLRESVQDILLQNVAGLLSDEQIDKIAKEIYGLTRIGGSEIVHQVGPNGFHRLIVDGKKSKWQSPMEIASVGQFIASTDVFIDHLPQVARIYKIKSEDFITESVQTIKD